MNVGKESEYQENKESLAQKRKGLISLIAMLNKHQRGLVYFGVSDDGRILKSQLNNKSLSELRTEIRDNIRPAIIPTIELLSNEDGQTYIRLEATGKDIPYSAYGEYRIRIGEEDCQIEPALMRKMLLSGMNDSLEEIASSNQDLHFEGLKRSLLLHGVKFGDASFFEKNEGLKNSFGEYNLQAHLLSDENDMSLKITTFDGNDKSKMVLRNEYGYQSLVLGMENILSYVSSLNATRVIMEDGIRKDIMLFDFSCFREAFINACLHSRWQENTPSNVFVFSNRITITSFGGLPYTLSKEDFFAGQQVVVNKGLQRIFSQLGFVEQTGFGVPFILNRLGRTAFEITPYFVNVTIPFTFNRKTNRLYDSSLNTISKGVLKLIDENPKITTSKMSEFLQTSLSNIKKNLKALTDKGYILRAGSSKSGSWIIIDRETDSKE